MRYVSGRMRAYVSIVLLAASLPLWAAPAAGELYTEAESRFLARNYTAALVEYDEFLQQYPSSDLVADVQYRRAVCLYQLGNYTDASSLLSEISQRYRWTRYIEAVPLWQGLALYRLSNYTPSLVNLNEYLSTGKDPQLVPRALLCKALDLEALQKIPEAADAARVVVTSYPTSEAYPSALVLLASLLVKEKSYAEVEQLVSTIDLSALPSPLRDELLWNRAEALRGLGRTADAAALYGELLDARTELSLAAHRRLFEAAFAQGDLPRMESLSRVMESRFGDTPHVMVGVWAALGVQNYKMGRADVAETYLQRAWSQRRTVTPDETVPLYLARIMEERNDAAGARSLLQEYVSLPGASSESALLALGAAARHDGDFPTAERYFTRFIDTFPKSARIGEAAAQLAVTQMQEGKLDEAAALLAKYLQTPAADPSRKDLLRLRAEVMRRKGNFGSAMDSLQEYVALAPNDTEAKVDLLELQFFLKQYGATAQGSDALLSSSPDPAFRASRTGILAAYIRGLSLVALKEYPGAAAVLEKITPESANKAGLGAILPYVGYYLGWAYAKQGNFHRAADSMDALVAAYPSHALTPKILFLAGWSHFNLGEFDIAAGYFSRAADAEGDASSAQKDFYLYAKALINGKKNQDAITALNKIIASSPQSPFADSALFDYAGLQASSGSLSGAVESYRALTATYPSSPLAEEAAYRVAETYYKLARYADAATAFTDYRRKYPNGRLFDAALYWGGESAYATGAKFDAALLWEQLANGYRQSAFRAAALRKAAEVYLAANDRQRALDFYTRFIADYPDEARQAKADIAAEKLRYQVQGVDSTEAELQTRIEHATGSAKLEATMDLARLYVYSGQAKVDQGYQMLQQVVSQTSGVTAARAQYLEGEYFYRKGDLLEAARRFLTAASTGASDRDFAASSVYRAAEMMKLAQRPDEVQALVKRLNDNFPSSPWTTKAQKLMERTK